MKKLDQSKAEWIVAQKRKEKTNKNIADAMGLVRPLAVCLQV